MIAKKNLVLASGLVIFAVAAIWFWARPASPKSAALTARLKALEMLGTCVAKLRPEGQVLLLSNPFTKEASYLDEKSQYERAGLRGLRTGRGARSTVKVVFPEIRPEFFPIPNRSSSRPIRGPR